MCPQVFSTSGILGIMPLSYASMTAMDSVVMFISIAITIFFAVFSVVNVAIVIYIYIYIAVEIYIDIYIVVDIAIVISISIGVSDDTVFHIRLKGVDKVFQCPDMSSEARVC